MTALLALLWGNRQAFAAVSVAALAASAAVYVMALRADNRALGADLSEAQARAEAAAAGAEQIRQQAAALIASRDAAAEEYADALARIRSAADSCLDQRLPLELLDR